MDVIVAGGHGRIGIKVLERLAARGDRARGLIRNPDHAADLERVRAAAGSGDERKRTVDYAACVKLLESAQALGIPRFVVVSSMGAGEPEGTVFEVLEGDVPVVSAVAGLSGA